MQGQSSSTQQTPATMLVCPICKVSFSDMSKHLKKTHLVINKVERRILLNLAAGRVNIRTSSCPVSSCTYSMTHLDRHIKRSHVELSIQERMDMVVQAKQKTTLKLLTDLRATSPTPPMATSLDQDEAVLEELGCGNEECQDSLRRYAKDLRKVRDQRDQLLVDIRVLCSKVQLLQRKATKAKRGGKKDEIEDSTSEDESNITFQESGDSRETSSSSEEEEEEEEEDEEEEKEEEEKEEKEEEEEEEEEESPLTKRPCLMRACKVVQRPVK